MLDHEILIELMKDDADVAVYAMKRQAKRLEVNVKSGRFPTKTNSLMKRQAKDYRETIERIEKTLEKSEA